MTAVLISGATAHRQQVVRTQNDTHLLAALHRLTQPITGTTSRAAGEWGRWCRRRRRRSSADGWAPRKTALGGYELAHRLPCPRVGGTGFWPALCRQPSTAIPGPTGLSRPTTGPHVCAPRSLCTSQRRSTGSLRCGPDSNDSRVSTRRRCTAGMGDDPNCARDRGCATAKLIACTGPTANPDNQNSAGPARTEIPGDALHGPNTPSGPSGLPRIFEVLSTPAPSALESCTASRPGN